MGDTDEKQYKYYKIRAYFPYDDENRELIAYISLLEKGERNTFIKNAIRAAYENKDKSDATLDEILEISRRTEQTLSLLDDKVAKMAAGDIEELDVETTAIEFMRKFNDYGS
jgi:hypothetical protein